MAKRISLGDYQEILTRMDHIVSAAVTLPEPFTGTTGLALFEKAIKDGQKLLPARYQRPYVDVLEQAVLQASVVLRALTPRASAKRRAVLQQLELVFGTLAAPIAQLNSPNHQRELKAFLAVISDVYKHFVDNRKIRTAAKSPLLWPNIDPLGFFTNEKASGPYTLAASADLPVALVSKPASQMKFLPLWLVDGHEVGGHSIFNSVDGFENELAALVEKKIRAAFQSGAIKGSTNNIRFAGGTGAIFDSKKAVTMEEFMVALWRQWLQEVSADAAGVLNMGPMFVDGLMLTLALHRPTWQLSTMSVFDSRRGFSEHPMDVVRALLAIEMLRKLTFKEAAPYADVLHDRLLEIQDEPLPQTLAWINRTGTRAVEIKLSDMLAVLPVVAEAILESKMTALAGHSLAEIMPWTDGDERAVRLAAAAILKGKEEAPDSVQARHVVAASLLAVERVSKRSDFVQRCATVHKAGIDMLNDMYEHQCLLCNVQTLKGGAKEPSEVQLRDLVRLVRNMRGSRR